MLRVYLDQNKWVDFTRYRAGLEVGVRFADAWTIAKEASMRGLASFPLSAIHYVETSNRTKTVSRLQLAATMAELSKLHTIANSKLLIPAEVDAAVATVLDSQSPPPEPVQVFGVGFAHAFNLPADWISSRFDEQQLIDAQVPAAVIAEGREQFIAMMEMAMLAHLTTTPESKQLSSDTRQQMRAVSQSFVDAQADLIKTLKAGGNMHRRDEAITRTDFVDIVHDFNVSCLNRGIIPNTEWVKDINFIETVLKLVPSKWVVRELRRVRLRNPQEKFVANDLNDFNGLSSAVVYCDVLVTEKVWSHHLNQTGLAAQYGTVVIHDLADLTDILIAQTLSE